ncbi:hypothetical protein DMENIID0001_065500 [Sergentomyia squamirostris]
MMTKTKKNQLLKLLICSLARVNFFSNLTLRHTGRENCPPRDGPVKTPCLSSGDNCLWEQSHTMNQLQVVFFFKLQKMKKRFSAVRKVKREDEIL